MVTTVMQTMNMGLKLNKILQYSGAVGLSTNH